MIVGTDRHPFFGEGFDCEGVLGEASGPVCGRTRSAGVHRPVSQLDLTQTDFEDTLDDLRSTSARLRAVQRDYAATQAALAASQQDLTLVEGEAEQQRAHKEAYLRQRDDAWVALDLARAELASARQEIGHQRGLLDEVIAENSRMRHRIAVAGEHRVDVARADLTAPCGDCGGPIRRGHAVERIPTTDTLRHVACPDKEN